MKSVDDNLKNNSVKITQTAMNKNLGNNGKTTNVEFSENILKI